MSDQSRPREWWIVQSNTTVMISAMPIANSEAIHVIEYSAYQELKMILSKVPKRESLVNGFAALEVKLADVHKSIDSLIEERDQFREALDLAVEKLEKIANAMNKDVCYDYREFANSALAKIKEMRKS